MVLLFYFYFVATCEQPFYVNSLLQHTAPVYFISFFINDIQLQILIVGTWDYLPKGGGGGVWAGQMRET